ncbi:serine hydrolase [uncultured Sphingomonas sp.]|uniref:serine hydrolase n=1 Tax=uncultured Sphingomonas sp. TaxID=158754 RepID=UPI0025D1CF2D|nr:serine hydrolase [uncultured Sphingomonas sp.]
MRNGVLLGLAGVLALVVACSGGVVPNPGANYGGRAPLSSEAQGDTGPIVSMPVPAARPLPVNNAAPARLRAEVDRLIADFPGKAGAAIRAVDDGWTVQRGGALSMPQQSVSKLWVALTVLSQRDAGKLRLDDPVLVTTNDLTLFHQPIASLVRGEGYQTTVMGLLTRALTQSDNTANDRLLTLVGGPSAVRAFIAEHQLGAIRFGPGERLLQSGTAGLTWNQSMALGRGFEAARARLSPEVRAAAMQRYIDNPPDGAAPLAIADALARLARGDLLSETSTRVMLDTMGASVTGRARLRAALPSGWTIAHKTGTGQELAGRNAGFNDVGLLTAPDGKRYAVAVMIGDTRAPMRVRQQLIQNVAAALTGGHASANVGEDASDG